MSPRRAVAYNVGMRHLVTAVLLLFALTASADAPGGLKRRVLFGAQLAPATTGGITVMKLTPGAPAAAAGLAEGDVILSIGGTKVSHAGEFVATMKTLGAGPAELDVVRNGEALKKTVQLTEAPREASTEFDVIYDAVRANDALRRTIITRPRMEGKRPAVLFAGGIGCYSLDNAPPAVDGYIALIHELTRRGFVVMRVEKSSMGDSEGMPCQLQDFENELAGYRAGMKKLRTYDYVDPERIFLIGHSIGGLVAPVIASEFPLRGVVALSTAGQKWIDYEDVNARRQFSMKGIKGKELEDKLRMRNACARRLLMDRQSPEDIVKAEPACQEYVQYPAHHTYMQQIGALDPAALWKRVTAPVLLIHGTSDFVTDADEHRRIAKVVNAAHPGHATVLLEEHMDHFMRDVASREASMRNVESDALDRQPMQTKVRADIAAWMKAKS
jgi:pimeloyl-ACP methyl ester carboxylesterase